MTMNKQFCWCAMVINNDSRSQLIEKLKTFDIDAFPDNWEIIAHHITIDPFNVLYDIALQGLPVTVRFVHIGRNNTAVALRALDFPFATNNSFPHVTLAINRLVGGKPKDSNLITEWLTLPEMLSVDGIIKNLL